MGDPRHIAYLLALLAEIEIVDDWHVLGLAGTGSHGATIGFRDWRNNSYAVAATGEFRIVHVGCTE